LGSSTTCDGAGGPGAPWGECARNWGTAGSVGNGTPSRGSIARISDTTIGVGASNLIVLALTGSIVATGITGGDVTSTGRNLTRVGGTNSGGVTTGRFGGDSTQVVIGTLGRRGTCSTNTETTASTQTGGLSLIVGRRARQQHQVVDIGLKSSLIERANQQDVVGVVTGQNSQMGNGNTLIRIIGTIGTNTNRQKGQGLGGFGGSMSGSEIIDGNS
jgi:hypothetical protein